MSTLMYEYRARMLRIVDGDTVHAELDLGIDVKINLTLRLAGINAPEMSTPEGIAARDALASMIGVGQIFTVNTVKDRREKYGRYLAHLSTAAVPDVNAQLVVDGHAAYSSYR